MRSKSVQEVKSMMDENKDFQLIDVREPMEYDICNIGAELIPMSEIPQSLDKISKSKPVVIHCKSGGRSGNVVQWLEQNHGFNNVYNLDGGILAWSDHIDPSVSKY